MTVNWWLVGVLALPGLLAAMVLFITWQNWRTRNWRSTIGRIVESHSASREVRSQEHRMIGSGGHGSATVISTDRIDRKNFAGIAYEYTVAGRKFLSRQVGVGKDHGNLDVVALLQRYPKGRPVTVWYDPASPDDSILERDDPRRLREAWLGVAALAFILVGGYYGFDAIYGFVQAHVRNPRRIPFIMFAIAAAVLVALMALGAVRGVRRMRAWPTADGVIIESHVEHARTRRTHHRRTTTTPFYIPRVIYRFTVEGVDIQGDQHGRMVSSTNQDVAARFAAALPVGTKVAVHYDPSEPTTAVVNPTAGMLPLGLSALAAVLFAIAYGLAVF